MEQFNVTGMSCAACSARVEKAVKSVPGVTGCSVSLLTNSMGVEGTAEDAAIIRAVEQAGYGASPKKAAAAASTSAELDALADHETPKLKRRLIASLGFLLVLMYFSMGHMMWGWPLPRWFDGNHIAMGLVQLLLAGIVMVINQKVIKIRQRHFQMIHQPDHKVRRRVVPQDQSAAFAQHAAGAIEEILRVRVVMKTVCTDDRVKRTFRKRQILAVSHKKFRVGKPFFLCHTNHFRRKVQADVVLLRVFFMQQLEHRAGAAAAVQHIVEGLFFQFCQDRRVIVLAHLVDPGVAAVIDLCSLGKLFDGKFFVLFRRHRLCSFFGGYLSLTNSIINQPECQQKAPERP